MSLLDRLRELKKQTPALAATAALATAYPAKAESNAPIEKEPTPIVEQARSDWKFEDPQSQEVYNSLPQEYKKFANKSFDERMMMRKEWEQRDYAKRLSEYNQILKENPQATLADLPNVRSKGMLQEVKLVNAKPGRQDYEAHIEIERRYGKLSDEQAKMAEEMLHLGRPLATIDKTQPLPEQLKQCGFNIQSPSDWNSDWEFEDLHSRVIYESLPQEYKKFANKSFDERMMMREEWEQRDYKKRLSEYNQVLQKNPQATLADLNPNTSLPNEKLANVTSGSIDYETHILKESLDGRLSNKQVKMAEEMLHLGRPLATIDKTQPLPEQLKQCGFDIMSNVANGQKEQTLSKRDASIYRVQWQESESLQQATPQNEEAIIDLDRRLEQEEDDYIQSQKGIFGNLFTTKTRKLAEGEYTPTPHEKINGKTVLIRQPSDLTYSYRDELVHRTADKLAKEEQIKQQAIQKNLTTGRE